MIVNPNVCRVTGLPTNLSLIASLMFTGLLNWIHPVKIEEILILRQMRDKLQFWLRKKCFSCRHGKNPAQIYDAISFHSHKMGHKTINKPFHFLFSSINYDLTIRYFYFCLCNICKLTGETNPWPLHLYKARIPSLGGCNSHIKTMSQTGLFLGFLTHEIRQFR